MTGEGWVERHPMDARWEQLDADVAKARRQLTLVRGSLRHNAKGRMVMGFCAEHMQRLERERDALERTLTEVEA